MKYAVKVFLALMPPTLAAAAKNTLKWPLKYKKILHSTLIDEIKNVPTAGD
jgi:hypothetical protein